MLQKCSKVNRVNIFRIYKYSRSIYGLDKEIFKFSQKFGWALACLEINEGTENLACLEINEGTGNLGTKIEEIGDKIDERKANFGAKIEEIEDKIENLPESFQRIMKDCIDELENGKSPSQ